MNIKIREQDKIQVSRPEDLFQIMRRILLRESKVDQEKEHFWLIGLNSASVLLYIELISLGSVRSTPVEPMNVYRIAVMKGATRVIAVHNHPSGTMNASEADKEITDRLIQVGRILNIQLEDHLIISPTTYISFSVLGLMAELEESVKYVPTYQIIERIRKQEKEIREEAVKAERTLRDKEKALRLETEQRTVNYLIEKQITIEQIAEILNLSPKEIKQILKRGQK